MRKLALLAGLLPFLNVFGQGYKVYQSDGKVDAYPGETAVSVTLNDDSLRYNGHEYVNLGLPSGTRWALTNVGADKSHKNGLHFHFAEAEIETLWGGDWCLPSIGQYQELINVCQWEWAQVAGNHGYKVTGPNGNTLFLPAAGMADAAGSFSNLLYEQMAGYWTREGYCFAFTSQQKGIDSRTPALQMSLRPVIGGTDPQDKRSEVLKDDVHECVDLGLSVLWATTNIGADTPDAPGYYFGPGFTEPRPQEFDWNNPNWQYVWYPSHSPYYTDGNMQIADYMYQYYENQGRDAEYQEWGQQSTWAQRKGFTEVGRWLLPEHDAATALWGDGWRMPTMAEYKELLEKTTRSTLGNSIIILQSLNGSSLTLPKAGYYSRSDTRLYSSSMYLTSSITEGYPCLVDVSRWPLQYDSYSASNGFYPIRPVKDRPKSGLTDEATKAGQEMVDLGLSVMWANCNWGAATPKDKGEYIACGETSPKQMYTKDNYHPGEAYTAQGMQTMLGKAGWMLPSKANMEELIEKCTWAREEDGYRVTGPNGNSIFLPYTGFREGASFCFPDELGFYRTSDVESGMALNIGNKGDNDFSATDPTPYYGMAVRPVMNPLQPVTEEARIMPTWYNYVILDKVFIPIKLNNPDNLWNYGIQFCYMKYMDEKESGAWTVSAWSNHEYGVSVNLQPGTTYYYRAYANFGDTLMLYGDIKQLHMSDQVHAVDLGLSVKWAPFNLGGANEYDLADWFAHPTSYGLDASQLPSTSYGFWNGSYLSPQTGWSDEWRMPTEAEFQELVDKCTWEWQEGNDEGWSTLTDTENRNGYRVTGPNGNSIFLPAGGIGTMGEPVGIGKNGYYWTQTPNEKPAGLYKFLIFSETGQKFTYGSPEYRSIRPVKK